MTITTFRRLKVTNWLDYEEGQLDGFIYLTEGSEIPTKPDYIQNYLHILKNEGFDHTHYGTKAFYLNVDRGEYQSDQLTDLENILFDWAEGEYHQGTYKIEEIKQRSIHNQFPNFDDKEGFNKLLNELDKYGFVDECWHNEAMPHVCKMMPTEKYPDRALRVWMDWKDHQWSDLHHDLKEGQTYYRFNVHLQGEYGDQDTTEFSKDFETMEQVLEFLTDFTKNQN